MELSSLKKYNNRCVGDIVISISSIIHVFCHIVLLIQNVNRVVFISLKVHKRQHRLGQHSFLRDSCIAVDVVYLSINEVDDLPATYMANEIQCATYPAIMLFCCQIISSLS